MSNRYPWPIDTRVRVALPPSMVKPGEDDDAEGYVRGYTRQGVRVELDDGRTRSFAWWRLVSLE